MKILTSVNITTVKGILNHDKVIPKLYENVVPLGSLDNFFQLESYMHISVGKFCDLLKIKPKYKS